MSVRFTPHTCNTSASSMFWVCVSFRRHCRRLPRRKRVSSSGVPRFKREWWFGLCAVLGVLARSKLPFLARAKHFVSASFPGVSQYSVDYAILDLSSLSMLTCSHCLFCWFVWLLFAPMYIPAAPHCCCVAIASNVHSAGFVCHCLQCTLISSNVHSAGLV